MRLKIIKIWGGHLLAIASERLLAQWGEMAVEHDPKIWRAVEIPGLEICCEKVYGNTALTFFDVPPPL